MEQNDVKTNDELMSLTDILRVVKKYFWTLVVTTILGGIILGGYAFFVATPKYKSTGAIMIQVQTSDEAKQVNTQESQRLIQSAVDLLTKIDLVPSKAAESLNSGGFNITKEQIRNNMSVSNSSDSLLIQISYISENKDNAKSILDEIIKTLIDITDDDSYNMTKTLKGNISYLYVSDAKYHSPNKILFTLVGILLGGTIGLIMVFLYEFINAGYKTKNELESEFGIQVLGEVPEYEINRRGNE